MKLKPTLLLIASMFALTSCGENEPTSTSSDTSIKEFALPSDLFIASGLLSDANIFYSFDTENKMVNVKRYYSLRDLYNDNPTPSQSYSEPYSYEFCKRLGDVAVYDNTIASITHGNYKYAYFYEKKDNGTKGAFYRYSGSSITDQDDPEEEKKYTGVSKEAVVYEECNLKKFEVVVGQEYVSDDSVQFALEDGTKLYYIKAKFDAFYKISIFYSVNGIDNWERFRSNLSLDTLTPTAARNRLHGLYLENYNSEVNTFQIEMTSHFAARVRLVQE